jgi:hypothetical protein
MASTHEISGNGMESAQVEFTMRQSTPVTPSVDGFLSFGHSLPSHYAHASRAGLRPDREPGKYLLEHGRDNVKKKGQVGFGL